MPYQSSSIFCAWWIMVRYLQGKVEAVCDEFPELVWLHKTSLFFHSSFTDTSDADEIWQREVFVLNLAQKCTSTPAYFWDYTHDFWLICQVQLSPSKTKLEQINVIISLGYMWIKRLSFFLSFWQDWSYKKVLINIRNGANWYRCQISLWYWCMSLDQVQQETVLVRLLLYYLYCVLLILMFLIP